MSAPMSRRLSWMIFPLAIIAWMAAPEWPARAGMMDNPWRAGWFPIASAWAEVHPVPVAVAVAQTLPAATAPENQVTVLTPSPVAKEAHDVPASSATVTAEVIVSTPSPLVATTAKTVPTTGTVLMLGDSLMGEVAAGLRQHLPRTFKVVDRHKSSTGLTNLGYYDWPGTAAADTAETKPQWVVIHMGANDSQDMNLAGRWVHFGSPEWQQVYLTRAELLLDRIHQEAPDSTIIWVGLPAMRSTAFDKRMDVIRGIQQQAAAARSVVYLDGHAAMGKDYAKDGVVDGGHRVILRAGDGIHYSRAGGTLLAHEAAEAPALDFPWGAQ